jgi:addiction module RelB/DinJ family antitoxin
MTEARLNIRIDAETKEVAEKVFRSMGLTMSSGINVFLTRVAAERAIPFTLSAAHPSEIGADAYAFEQAAVLAVRERVEEMRYNAAPIARFDDEKRRPYLEYSDGRRNYELED